MRPRVYPDIPLFIKDLDQDGVISPSDWFRVAERHRKVEELSNVKKYVLTFEYMRNLKNMVEKIGYSVEWYPNLYIIGGKPPIGFMFITIGAPMAATTLEELIFMGGREFILIGGAGVLRKIPVGEIIIPTGSIRDEGTSYHYLPPQVEAKPSPGLVEGLKKACERLNIKFHLGRVWTTDAPYRETPRRILKFREMGAVCVDMEASACFAVAMYRNVRLAALFYAGDRLTRRRWYYRKRGKGEKEAISRKLFSIAALTLSLI